MPDDHDRLTEVEPDDTGNPDPGTPPGVVEVPTEWLPSTDDETEQEEADDAE